MTATSEQRSALLDSANLSFKVRRVSALSANASRPMSVTSCPHNQSSLNITEVSMLSKPIIKDPFVHGIS